MAPQTNRTDSGGSLGGGDTGSTTLQQSVLMAPPALTQSGSSSRRMRLSGNRLRFANRTRIYLIPTIDELRQEEYEAMWVTQADEKASQADVVKNIMRLRQGGPEDHHDEEHCGRGLEHMRSQAHMDQRRMNKEAVTHGVLDLQDEHFDGDVFDEDALAEVAASASRWSRELAVQRAAEDEAYVRLHVRPEHEEEAQMERDQEQERPQEDSGEEEDSVDQLQILEEALVLSEESEEESEDEDQEHGSSSSSSYRGDHQLRHTTRPRSASSTIAQDHPIINATSGAARAAAAATDSFLNRISNRTTSAATGKASTPPIREGSNGRQEVQDS